MTELFFWLSVSVTWGTWQPAFEAGPQVVRGNLAGEYVSLEPCTVSWNQEWVIESRINQSILLAL